MGALWNYFIRLVTILSFWWKGSSLSLGNTPANENQTESSESSNKNDITVTRSSEVFEVQEENSPAQPVNSHSDHLHLQFYQEETTEVDKINLKIKCAGKTTEVEIFPLERISVLLKEACGWAGKKTEKMCLVFDGDRLDMNKTVSQYNLRGGMTVNLIHT